MVEEIIASLGLQAAVETGTYLGDTAAKLATLVQKVFTVELDPERHTLAVERFANDPVVRVYGGDSRTFLRELTQEPRCPLQRVLFYLDAHWFHNLPLKDEVAWIVRHWRRSVILIDDFQVPGDDGYAYDRYPGVGELTPAYLGPLQRCGLHWFWPTLASTDETGARRGCTVLAWDPDTAAELRRLATLRPQDVLPAPR